jgi:AraC family transcriptional regulator of adaptative response/methylated-DNA-[protein]-cysteine methyltransferase
VEARDERAAGAFVYAVTTTGVYCRTGCGARRPLRRHVEYFAAPADAVAAGYRACRRCRPDEAHPDDPGARAVVALCRELERGDDVALSTFAAEHGYSERHLRRRFAEVIGAPVGAYARAVRAERVRADLREGVPVTRAALDAGYGSSRAFYEHAAPRLGMSPARYRDGGRGERIAYTSLVTPLGVVVAARSSRGVCFVQLGPDEAGLERALAGEFPSASVVRDDEGLADVASVLMRAARGEADATALPVDLVGTAFQVRVWEALRGIPLGATRTYTDVAREIGAPTAVRAVASACAANTVALAVPCHRVLRRDGSLGGYRWGVEVKAGLLAAEARE